VVWCVCVWGGGGTQRQQQHTLAQLPGLPASSRPDPLTVNVCGQGGKLNLHEGETISNRGQHGCGGVLNQLCVGRWPVRHAPSLARLCCCRLSPADDVLLAPLQLLLLLLWRAAAGGTRGCAAAEALLLLLLLRARRGGGRKGPPLRPAAAALLLPVVAIGAAALQLHAEALHRSRRGVWTPSGGRVCVVAGGAKSEGGRLRGR
jgi:hypothetical protein